MGDFRINKGHSYIKKTLCTEPVTCTGNPYYIIAIICYNKKKLKVLTVRRLDEESVLTQYLFQSISRSFLSNDDLK